MKSDFFSKLVSELKEYSMADKRAFEAIERKLHVIRQNNKFMEGITFLFSSDFRRTLPVVFRATAVDKQKVCLKILKFGYTCKYLNLKLTWE